MSLVGPRPVTDAEMRRYYGSDADRSAAGETGNRRSVADLRTQPPDVMRNAARLDLQFVRNRSLRMYLRILLRTVPEVWSGTNSW